MIEIRGQDLQRRYSNGAQGAITQKEREKQKKDFEALKKVQEAKRVERETRMNLRDVSKVTEDVKLEKQIEIVTEREQIKVNDIIETAEALIEDRITEAKEKTNALARKYGLKEPNNPEALKHDRFHCFNCDTKLHIPNAYKSLDDDIASLFDDESVRHLCCYCFGRMSHEEITLKKDEATPEIRMAIYNPEESVNKNMDIDGKIKEVNKMSELDRIRLRSRIKQYKNVVNMIGTIKHNDLEDEMHTELSFLKQFPTRYEACTQN